MESISLNREALRRLTSGTGFTLVELMVVLAIITIVTSAVITSQGTFNKTLVLTNTAYDIALTLRSAETFGISSRGSGASANAGYGLHFENAPTNTFTLFIDTTPSVSTCHGVPVGGPNAPDAKPGNCVYDQGERIKDYVLGNGIIVNDFCVLSNAGSSCARNGGLSMLDIVFMRPNSDTFIRGNGVSYTSACLTVASSNALSGPYRYISIGAAGQIVANAPSCP